YRPHPQPLPQNLGEGSSARTHSKLPSPRFWDGGAGGVGSVPGGWGWGRLRPNLCTPPEHSHNRSHAKQPRPHPPPAPSHFFTGSGLAGSARTDAPLTSVSRPTSTTCSPG